MAPNLADAEHDAIRLLLPWQANGRLEGDECALVTAHLETCAECRAELADERRLAAALDIPVPNPDSGWAALAARLDAPLPAIAPRRERRRWTRVDRGRVRWLVAGQSAVIAALAAWIVATPLLQPAPRQGDFHVLGAAPIQPTGNVLAMFRPSTTEQELRRLLTDVDARVVNGPTSAGAYVLVVPGDRQASLATLRRNRNVTLAEPIGEVAPQ